MEYKNYSYPAILLSVFIILSVTLIAFSPSLWNEFTNWDDNRYVTENSTILFLSYGSVKKIFTSSYYTLYHPLTILSYAVERHFFYLNPSVYHKTNLMLHLFNTFFIFCLILRLGNNMYASSITSLLWGIHPLHVESVAWISERKDVLSTFFFMLTLLAYIEFRKKISVKFYILSLFMFLLSLLSKPVGVTLPFVLLLLDCYFLKRKFNLTIVTDKIPFFFICLIFAFTTLNSFSSSVPCNFFVILNNSLIACYGLIFYLFKVVWPINLSIIYNRPEHFSPLIYLSPLLILILTAGVIYSKRYTEKIWAGFLFFFITIFPLLQLVPNMDQIVADRYTYIPYTGLFYIAGEFFYWIYIKYASNIFRILFITIFTLMIVILSMLTWQRCQVWHDSITLWNDVLEKNPRMYQALYNRACGYMDRGDYDKAADDYDFLLNHVPDASSLYGSIYNNRGYSYYKKGDYDRAIKDFNNAINLRENFSSAFNNMAKVYMDKGDYDRAILNFDRAVKIDENYVDAINNRGYSYYKKGEYDKALIDFNRALSISPYSFKVFSRNKPEDFFRAYMNRGNFYYERGDMKRALNDFNMALNINADCPALECKRACIYKKKISPHGKD